MHSRPGKPYDASSSSAAPYTLSEVEAGPPCCEPVPHLEINQLRVSYHGKPVLSDLSLSIYRGCITAFIGPSGCGKSSFLNAMNRMTDLIPGASVSGTVLLNGEDIYSERMKVEELRRRVGMIFQKPNPFPLSIRRNFDLPLKEYGIKKAGPRRERMEHVLRQVGLWEEVKDRLGASAHELSGGQQQRLCIARALALEPEILLMDEPCSALDPISSEVVENMIQRLQGEYTIVIVTHNLAQAKRLANYAAFFWLHENQGKLIEFGLCQPLFDEPQNPLTASYISGTKG